jgi:hypothetical protein
MKRRDAVERLKRRIADGMDVEEASRLCDLEWTGTDDLPERSDNGAADEATDGANQQRPCARLRRLRWLV